MPSKQRSLPLMIGISLFGLAWFALGEPAKSKNFVTHLDGSQEVPPPGVTIVTNGQGQAIFRLSDDELSVSYKLIASNIENVVASHIHLGAAGVNGPVVVFLFGPAPPGGGRTDGVLSEGVFTAANLTGPLTGQPLSALIEMMRAGTTYVNVHTNDGIAPTNTGPGDFPGGEIRGQIIPRGPK